MSWHCLLMCASCILAVGFLAGRGVVQGIGSSLRWVLGSARDQWPRGYAGVAVSGFWAAIGIVKVGVAVNLCPVVALTAGAAWAVNLPACPQA
jgi:hypothetical protein